jgi:hypothetical protein
MLQVFLERKLCLVLLDLVRHTGRRKLVVLLEKQQHF